MSRKPEDITAKERYMGILKFLHVVAEYDFHNDWGLAWMPESKIDGVEYSLYEDGYLHVKKGDDELTSYGLWNLDEIPDDFPFDQLLKETEEDIEKEIASMKAEVKWMENILSGLVTGKTIWHSDTRVAPIEEEKKDGA